MEGMRYLIEVLVVLMMIGGAGGILYGVLKGTLAFSGRTIQFLALAVVLPTMIVLAIEGRIGSEATTGIIGVVVGFALSSMSKHE
jgi:hypothetical protein